MREPGMQLNGKRLYRLRYVELRWSSVKLAEGIGEYWREVLLLKRNYKKKQYGELKKVRLDRKDPDAGTLRDYENEWPTNRETEIVNTIPVVFAKEIVSEIEKELELQKKGLTKKRKRI